MNKTSLSVLITALFLLVSHPFALASEKMMKDEHSIIIIANEGEDDLPNGPRTPVFNPFSALLTDSNIVLLESSCYYGDISINLFSTAGDNYSDVFHTEDGSIEIPISGNSGYYTITLETESGQGYYGAFYL